MWQMYPHAIDRLRVMHFLLVAWRKSMRRNEPADFPVYKQEQLATDSGLSVGTISEIEGSVI
jgi:hypothetical protein